MTVTIGRALTGASAAISLFTVLSPAAAPQDMPRTTTESIRGAAKVTTEKVSGTVLQAEGTTLAVRMSTGEMKEFVVPPDRKFVIDGRQLTVNQLEPGTELQATVTTMTTPITQRTTTIGTGTVWFVNGNSVIVTLPNGENRSYTVNEDYRFNVGGEKASVHDLRKGMKISAQKIVAEPKTEVTRDTVVTGHAPRGQKP